MIKLAIHQIFDNRYKLEELLGEGGMGAVYRAVELGTERRLALKLIHAGLSSSADSLTRFRREAETLSQLSHKNIVQLYRYGVLESTPYLAMELLNGKTLREVLNDRAQLPAKEALEIAHELAQGLAAAHERGIVHRDIKPSNIFITYDGQIKIIDFGLCKRLPGDGQEVQKLTQSGLLIGSVHYMSPEACMGKPQDKASDVYSVGAVIFEMISGQPPYDYETPIGILAKHVNDSIPKLTERTPLLPGGAALDRLLSKCLAKEAGDRFTMSDLVSAIEQTVQDFSDTPPKKLAHGPKRRLFVPIALTLALVAAAGIVLSIPEATAKLVRLPCCVMKAKERQSYTLLISDWAAGRGLWNYERALLTEEQGSSWKENDHLMLSEVQERLALAASGKNQSLAATLAIESLTWLSHLDADEIKRADQNRLRRIVDSDCAILSKCETRTLIGKLDSIEKLRAELSNSFMQAQSHPILMPLYQLENNVAEASGSKDRYFRSLVSTAKNFTSFGAYQKVLAPLEKAISLLPEIEWTQATAAGPEVFYLMGNALVHLDDPGAAVKCFKKADELTQTNSGKADPSSAFKIKLNLATSLIRTGQSKSAVEYLKQAEGILQGMVPAPPSDSQEWLGLLQGYCLVKHQEGIFRTFKTFAQNPSAESLFWQIILASALDPWDLKQESSILTPLMTMSAGSHNKWKAICMAELALANLVDKSDYAAALKLSSQAEQELARVNAPLENQVPTLHWKSFALEKLGRKNEALQVQKAADEMMAKYAGTALLKSVVWSRLGHLYEREGIFADALRYYEQSLAAADQLVIDPKVSARGRMHSTNQRHLLKAFSHTGKSHCLLEMKDGNSAGKEIAKAEQELAATNALSVRLLPWDSVPELHNQIKRIKARLVTGGSANQFTSQ